jgi:two-component system, LytTR family, sensor kinase
VISRFLASTSSKPLSWSRAITLDCSYAYIAAAFSPAAIFLADHFRIEPPKRLRSISVHVLAGILFSAASQLTFQGLARLMGLYQWPANALAEVRALAWGLSDGAPLYWVIVLVHNAGYYLKKYEASAAKAADLNAQLAQAQLQSLKMQLHPHFLFNSLHSISELIYADPRAAERMVIGLSHLLRASLANYSPVEVPLERELELTRLYLDIEKTRFDERLHVEIRIADGTHLALVPNLILQPLVENSIKHGICAQPGNGQIAVEAVRDAGCLVITIRDNGAGFDKKKGPIVEGIGLRTTRARLEKLYGNMQSFHFVRRAGSTEAVIRLPFRVEAAESGSP